MEKLSQYLNPNFNFAFVLLAIFFSLVFLIYSVVNLLFEIGSMEFVSILSVAGTLTLAVGIYV